MSPRRVTEKTGATAELGPLNRFPIAGSISALVVAVTPLTPWIKAPTGQSLSLVSASTSQIATPLWPSVVIGVAGLASLAGILGSRVKPFRSRLLVVILGAIAGCVTAVWMARLYSDAVVQYGSVALSWGPLIGLISAIFLAGGAAYGMFRRYAKYGPPSGDPE